MFVVFWTYGEYSDYGVDSSSFLVGDTDPEPILSAFVAHHSGGLWQSWADMWRLPKYRDTNRCLLDVWAGGRDMMNPDELQRRRGLVAARETIVKGVADHLKANGFREASATELHH